MGRFPSSYAGAQQRRRMTAQDVHLIHQHVHTSTAELSRMMGFSATAIRNVRVGNTWPELHPLYRFEQSTPHVPLDDSPALSSFPPDVPGLPAPPPPAYGPDVQANIRSLMAELDHIPPVQPPAPPSSIEALAAQARAALGGPPVRISIPPSVGPSGPRLPGITLGMDEPESIYDPGQ